MPVCLAAISVAGSDVCAATNGLNREEFDQQGTQMTAGFGMCLRISCSSTSMVITSCLYRRTSDDDNTGSLFMDRQFYVNHEADYSSHELQAFYDFF